MINVVFLVSSVLRLNITEQLQQMCNIEIFIYAVLPKQESKEMSLNRKHKTHERERNEKFIKCFYYLQNQMALTFQLKLFYLK